jgi:quercetin dioxygenase-like cupin family protein
MARTGDVIVNPAMGARIVFREVAADTGGSLVEFDFYLRAGGVVAVDHLHPQQEERFEVISGLMRGHVDGRPHALGPGATSVVGPGVSHAWRNASTEEAHLRVQFRPALRIEHMFETVFALGAQGRTDDQGVPDFPSRLAMLAEFSDEVRPAAMPAGVHRILVRTFKRRHIRRP